MKLADHKAETAASEAAEVEETPATQAEEVIETAEGEEAQAEVSTDSPAKVDGEETEGGEASEDDWLKSDSEDELGSERENIPVAPLLEARKKLRGKLRAANEEITERDSENERLRAEIEQLKAGKSQPAAQVQDIKRPDRLDYDTDEDMHAAEDAYFDAKLAQRMDHIGQSNDASNTQKRLDDDRSVAVDAHYTRAAKIAADNNISDEVYQAADLRVRQVIESVAPDFGDMITEEWISKLGPGSEQVFYFIGRNREAQKKLGDLLSEDNSGFKAFGYLSELKATKTSARNISSNAPKPPTRLKGSGSSPGEKAAKKDYDAAKTPNDKYHAKKAAKAAGHNVTNW